MGLWMETEDILIVSAHERDRIGINIADGDWERT